SPPYLEASVIVAAAAREQARLQVLVNMSQFTVSQMDLTHMTSSPQQRQHWLAEQALNWSCLPGVHVRPTGFPQSPFFFEWAAESIRVESVIRLPFGSGRSSPIDTQDVAEVVADILAEPGRHIGKAYDLTGAHSEDMNAVAAEYSEALGQPIAY